MAVGKVTAWTGIAAAAVTAVEYAPIATCPFVVTTSAVAPTGEGWLIVTAPPASASTVWTGMAAEAVATLAVRDACAAASCPGIAAVAAIGSTCAMFIPLIVETV